MVAVLLVPIVSGSLAAAVSWLLVRHDVAASSRAWVVAIAALVTAVSSLYVVYLALAALLGAALVFAALRGRLPLVRRLATGPLRVVAVPTALAVAGGTLAALLAGSGAVMTMALDAM